MKWIKRIGLGVVLLVVAAVAIVYFSVNSIVRSAVQRQASASLNVPTTLGGVKLAIFGGSLDLNDLEVGSPSGYSAPHLFTLDGASVAVHYGDLTSTPIRISKIVITNPTVFVEQNNLKLNLQALMSQMPATPTDSNGQPIPAKKLIIDDLEINNAKVSFLPGLPGLSAQTDIPVPSLSMKNIGNADGAQNGAAIKDVIMQVATALTSKAGQSGKLPIDVNNLLNTQLTQVQQQLNGAVDQQIKNVTAPLPAAAQQEISNQVQQRLGGLLGGNKNNGDAANKKGP